MLRFARQKWEKAVGAPVWATCGCSLLIAFSTAAGVGQPRDGQGRQRSSVHQDPAQQPAPTPQQEPPPTPPAQQQTPPAQQPTTPPQTAPTAPPASKTPLAKGKRLTERERAWLVLQDGVKENSAEKRAKAVNALGLLSANREAEGMAIEALGDDKYNVRSAAATALGVMYAVHAIPQLEKALDDDEPAVVLAAQQSETRLLRQEDHGDVPSLVLWPEDVVSLDTPLAGSPEESALSGLARTLHTTLVVGVTETVSSTTFRNEIVAFGPDGALVARFEKVHRVPFGEYVPDRGFFAHFGNLSSVPLDSLPGTGTGLLDTPAAPLGAMVSYEVFYADRGRGAVRAGAQLLIVPTNTSSYATAQVPTQEIAASTVQAVQQGRDLLQAAPTGYSAAITNRGTLLERSVLGAPQIVPATLSRRAGWTVYVRYGDFPPLALAVVALVGAWVVSGRHRRRPGRSSRRSRSSSRRRSPPA